MRKEEVEEMVGLADFLKFGRRNDSDNPYSGYTILEAQEAYDETWRSVRIRFADLVDSDNLYRIVRNELIDGNVLILSLKMLKDDLDTLKRVVDRVKNIVNSYDGDIVLLGDDWLLIAPKNIEVERSKIRIEDSESYSVELSEEKRLEGARAYYY